MDDRLPARPKLATADLIGSSTGFRLGGPNDCRREPWPWFERRCRVVAAINLNYSAHI